MSDNPISRLAGIDPDFTGGRLPEDFLADRTGERDALHAENERLKADVQEWAARHVQLRDENERLRAVLKAAKVVLDDIDEQPMIEHTYEYSGCLWDLQQAVDACQT